MMFYSKEKNSGFTLIELLVVIAIIGILSSVVLASLNSARRKGRDARRISDVKQLQLALELNHDANQTYPLATSTLVTNGYISSLPVDPSSFQGYSYLPLDTNGTDQCTATPCPSYVLGAVIEGGGSAVPQGDVDTDFSGETDGFDCADPLYCVIP